MEKLSENTSVPAFKSQTFGGYAKPEVNRHVAMLEDEKNELLQENLRLKAEIERYKTAIARHERIEESVDKMIIEAKSLKQHAEAAAAKEVRLIKMQARQTAEVILNEARAKADYIRKDALSQHQDRLEEMRKKIKYMENYHGQLLSNAEVIIKTVRGIACTANSVADTLESKKNVAALDSRSFYVKARSNASKPISVKNNGLDLLDAQLKQITTANQQNQYNGLKTTAN